MTIMTIVTAMPPVPPVSSLTSLAPLTLTLTLTVAEVSEDLNIRHEPTLGAGMPQGKKTAGGFGASALTVGHSLLFGSSMPRRPAMSITEGSPLDIPGLSSSAAMRGPPHFSCPV